MTRRNNHFLTRAFWLSLTLTILLSCRLPFGLFESKTPEEEIGETLLEGGLMEVENIALSEDMVVIHYEQLIEEDQETMLSGWLYALEAAAESQPDVDEIVLETTYLGNPFVRVTAQSEDVQSFSAQEIGLEDFIDRLQIENLRSPESMLSQALFALDIELIDVVISDDTVEVHYHPSPVEDPADLMQEWIEIFGTVIQEGLDCEWIRIRAFMPDTSVTDVEVKTLDLIAFYEGEQSVFEFLTTIQLGEEPLEE